MEKENGIFEIVSIVVLVFLFIDFLGFVAWSFSGQLPADSFYIGSITHSFISLFF